MPLQLVEAPGVYSILRYNIFSRFRVPNTGKRLSAIEETDNGYWLRVVLAPPVELVIDKYLLS